MLVEIARGKSNMAIAESLFLTKRAVEKHINAIFLKLGLANAEDVSKRVAATLMLLSESGSVIHTADRTDHRRRFTPCGRCTCNAPGEQAVRHDQVWVTVR